MSFESDSPKVRAHSQRPHIGLPIGQMCGPSLGSHLHSSMSIDCICKMEITCLQMAEEGWNTVHEFWEGRGNNYEKGLECPNWSCISTWGHCQKTGRGCLSGIIFACNVKWCQRGYMGSFECRVGVFKSFCHLGALGCHLTYPVNCWGVATEQGNMASMSKVPHSTASITR
jgi:hypothetical protein